MDKTPTNENPTQDQPEKKESQIIVPKDVVIVVPHIQIKMQGNI